MWLLQAVNMLWPKSFLSYSSKIFLKQTQAELPKMVLMVSNDIETLFLEKETKATKKPNTQSKLNPD